MKIHLGFTVERPMEGKAEKSIETVYASATIEGDAELIQKIIRLLKEAGLKVS